jgi:hypothetical protein
LISAVLGVDDVAPVEVAALQTMDEHLCGGDVGGQRDVVHITQAQQRHLIGLTGLCIDGVAEEQEQIDLVAGDAGRDLLVAALDARQESLDLQARCLGILPVVPVATNLCWLRIRQYAVQN